VSEVLLNSCGLLRPRVLGFPARIAHRQIQPLLIFPVPALRGILGWVTQLMDGWSHAFAEPDVEFDRSNPVFVLIQERPPGSRSFCLQPQSAQRSQIFLEINSHTAIGISATAKVFFCWGQSKELRLLLADTETKTYSRTKGSTAQKQQ
jgi:hypothetical protein